MSNKMSRNPIYLRSSSIRRRLLLNVFNCCGLGYSRASTRGEVLEVFQMLWPLAIRGGLRRIGSDGDGGYLIPSVIPTFDALFSAGIANNADFEAEFLVANSNAEVYMLDGSISDSPLEGGEDRAKFLKKFLGSSDQEDEIGFDQWVNECHKGSSALLSMDIEGAEYEVLLAARNQSLSRFAVMVIEFHGFNMVNSKEGMCLARSLLRKLTDTHLVCHFHVNNYSRPVMVHGVLIPTVFEITLVRKGLVEVRSDESVSLPHKLDVDNCNKPTYPLFEGFHRGVLNDESDEKK